MHCTVHCLRVNPMFYHFPTYLLLSSIVFLSMLCWTSCSHNFVLLVVLYIVVVPPCYAFEPSVMCGNHQKVDNTEAAERLALVEPQLSPEKVVSLFDKFHTHTHNYLQWLSCFSSVSLRKTRIVSAVQRPCRHYWGLESLPIFGSLFTSLTWMYWHLVLKGAAAKERNLDQRGSRGEECRHVRDSLYHMSMRANSTLRTQSGRTCTGTHLIE